MTDKEIGSERHHFCRHCGAEAVTGGSFCSECGGSLIKATEQGASTDTQPTDASTTTHTKASGDVESLRKRRRWLWPVGVAVLLVAASVIFGVPQIRHDVLGNGSATQASFGVPCSQNPACSGSSGNSGGQGSSGTTGTSNEYTVGTQYGSFLASEGMSGANATEACSSRASVQNNASNRSQFDQGCVEGFNTTPTTRPQAGQVGQGTTNEPCSPCGSDVQPYSGNSGGGAGDVQPYSGNS